MTFAKPSNASAESVQALKGQNTAGVRQQEEDLDFPSFAFVAHLRCIARCARESELQCRPNDHHPSGRARHLRDSPSRVGGPLGHLSLVITLRVNFALHPGQKWDLPLYVTTQILPSF